MPFSTSNDVSLYYDVAGDGPALCLINGYRLSGEAWPGAFIARLSARCSVLSFDNRGTGRSDKPDAGYEFANMAKDVIGLLDELGISRVHLFGFSMGGAIAQEVAIRHPSRVGRLILFGTFCGGIWAEPTAYSVFRRLLVTENQTPEEAARQAWPVTYTQDYLAANAEAVEQQMRRELEHPTPMFVARRQMEALRKFNSYRDLPCINAPTLVAAGTHDILVKPRNAKILASRIPDARLELLADLGHRAIWEAPEEIADLIGDFITRPIGKSHKEHRPEERRASARGKDQLSAAIKQQEAPLTQNANQVLGTWKLRSYEREEIATGRRHDQFGAQPDGYLGYAPDGRMYAIFARHDRVMPADVVPTDEEGVQLLGSMVAYAGTYTLGDKQVVHHIDISWNQGWTGTDQLRFFELDGNTLTITTAPYRSYRDGKEGRSILVWDKVPDR
jgi:pimeloyl-ACP methyl ester carboxylesterase